LKLAQRRLVVRQALVGVCVFGLLIFVPLNEAHGVDCGTSVGGDVGRTDGTYGGGGSHRDCPSGGANGGGTDDYVVTRFVRAEPALCAGTPDALQEIIEYRDPASGALVDRVVRCVGPNIPRQPQPPAPPSATEVVSRLPLPPPLVNTSPPGRGLVGFETWLWWGGDANPPPVTVVVDGWSATVTPVLLGVDWDMGNGDHVAGNGTGSEESPSAKYTYETHCDCTITVTLTWGGTVTLTHPLAPAPIVVDAPPVPFATSAPYDVVEREAVVVG
jgi:hypothetical protein